MFRSTVQRLGRRTLTLFVGTSAAQIILVLAAPILTRLYGAESFGVLALVVSAGTVIGAVVSLTYDRAIVLPELDDDAEQLIYLAACAAIVLAGMLAVTLTAGWPLFGGRLAGDITFLWAVPVVVLFFGISQIGRSWLARCGDFSGIARASIVQSLLTVTLQVSLAGVIGGALGLLVGFAGGLAVAALLLTYLVARSTSLRPEVPKIVEVARRYRQFPKLMTPSTLVNVASQEAPVVLLAMYYGLETAGVYMLCQRVIFGPVGLLANSFSQVQYVDNARNAHADPASLKRHFRHTASVLFLISVPVSLLIALFGATAVELVFGKQWSAAGPIIMVLAVQVPFQIAFSATVQFNPINRQDALLLWNVVRLVGVAASIILASRLGASPIAAVALIVATLIVFYVGSALHYVAACNTFVRMRTVIQ